MFDGLFCGRDEINKVPDDASAKPFLAALEVLKAEGRAGLSIEYATDKKEIAAAAKKCAQAKTLSFIDQEGNRALGRIPAGRPAQENPEHVTDFKQARNFLPMQQSIAFGSRGDWVAALADTNYDLLILDPFWRGSEALTADDIKTLKLKRLGTRRQIFASLSLSRAQDTRFLLEKRVGRRQPALAGRPGAGFAQPDPGSLLGSRVEGNRRAISARPDRSRRRWGAAGPCRRLFLFRGYDAAALTRGRPAAPTHYPK